MTGEPDKKSLCPGGQYLYGAEAFRPGIRCFRIISPPEGNPFSGGFHFCGTFFFFRYTDSFGHSSIQVKEVKSTVQENRFTDEEHEAWMNRIVQEYGNAILRLCLLYLHDRHLAEDAAQDSLIKISKNRNSLRAGTSEKAWIMRVVTNTCRDYYRTAWMRHVDRHAVLEELDLPVAFDDGEQEEQERNKEVLRAVMALSRPLREVVLLRYYQEMKIAEIAKSLRLSESAVNKRLRKALDQLKPELREVYFDE